MGTICCGRKGRGRCGDINPSLTHSSIIHPCDDAQSDEPDLPLREVEILPIPVHAASYSIRPSQLVDLAIDHLDNPVLDRSESIKEATTLLRTLANLPKRKLDYLRLWHALHERGVV